MVDTTALDELFRSWSVEHDNAGRWVGVGYLRDNPRVRVARYVSRGTIEDALAALLAKGRNHVAYIAASPADDPVFSFGKYAGLRLTDLAQTDPKYCEWLLGEDWFLEHHAATAARLTELLEQQEEPVAE